MNTNRPLTVAIVAACPIPWPRGTPIRAYRIAESLSQLGHDVHVISYHLGERFDYPFQIHRIPDVPSYHKTSPGPSIGKITVLNPALAKLAKSISKRIDFDIVLAIHMEGLLVARQAMPSMPIVYDAHTSLSGELPDYFTFFPRSFVSWAGAQLDKRIPRKADFTTAVSENLKTRLLHHKAVSDTSVEVIPSGVEYDQFNLPVSNVRQATEIIFTGNDAPYQRLDLLLRAFELVVHDKPNAKLKLVGSAGFSQEREFVAQRSLTHNVDILSTPFEDELKHLAIAAIAVSPRTDCEGIPQKLLNYMAAGKAIVACEGSAVHLRHGVTGLRVNNNDPSAMAEALLTLIDDPELASRLGQAAQDEARREFSWQTVGNKIEAVFRRTIAKHRANEFNDI